MLEELVLSCFHILGEIFYVWIDLANIITKQVLSNTVAKAHTMDNHSRSATAEFVDMIDKFFDCHNVGNYTDGKFHRKCFQQPYRSPDDFRFKVLYLQALPSVGSTCIIMGYFLVATGHLSRVPEEMGISCG